MSTIFPIYDLPTAQKGILKRRTWAETEYPHTLLAGIERIFGEALSPEAAVSHILADVRQRGDQALIHWSKTIDGAGSNELLVPATARRAALDQMAPDLRSALEHSAERIAAFHRRQPAQSWMHVDAHDGTLGQIVRPLQSAGVYVPAGTAPLPSSLLMAAVIARVAGVETIIACAPPDRDSGQVPDVILAAAEIAGVDALYALGGAQAIGAMAFGTETVPAVDKIAGPGGIFVTLAKRQVFGTVGIDGLPGPTETVVIADDTADPEKVAADILAQAEHDILASAILLTPNQTIAERVQISIARRIQDLSRSQIIADSLDSRGGAVITPDLVSTVAAANSYAPEHLCLSVADPWSLVPQIKNAGGIFIGENSFEVLGDYIAGPSHIMPTEGTARFASPLNIEDFVKRISLIGMSNASSAELSPIAARIAQSEGLDAHAAAAHERG